MVYFNKPVPDVVSCESENSKPRRQNLFNREREREREFITLYVENGEAAVKQNNNWVSFEYLSFYFVCT